jgi:glycerol kinase
VKAILALDQGTTSSRAIVFDHGGNILAVSQQEFTQHYPKAGWVEHDPAEIWRTQRDVAVKALFEARLAPADVAAIGITNQRETTVLWDRKTGQPVHNAIVWQDRRTSQFCDQLKAQGHLDLVQKKTGLVIDAYFSGSKVRWLLDNVPGARDRARRGELAFGTIDTWLIYNLTGGALHVTDPSNASRTMLFNIHTNQWDDELLKLLDVPREVLPQVRASSEKLGQTKGDVLGAPVTIAGIGGDQQAALFGQTCFSRGLAKLRDGLGVIKSSADVEKLAATVPDNGGVYLVPAFAGLGAPHWDQYARGTITGITRGTTAAHFARAALESIAYQVADILDVSQGHRNDGAGRGVSRGSGGRVLEQHPGRPAELADRQKVRAEDGKEAGRPPARPLAGSAHPRQGLGRALQRRYPQGSLMKNSPPMSPTDTDED